jgi:hypothetical protein
MIKDSLLIHDDDDVTYVYDDVTYAYDDVTYDKGLVADTRVFTTIWQKRPIIRTKETYKCTSIPQV